MHIRYMTYQKFSPLVVEPRCLIRYGIETPEEHRATFKQIRDWTRGGQRPSILVDFNRWWFATLVANRIVFSQYSIRRDGKYFVFALKRRPLNTPAQPGGLEE